MSKQFISIFDSEVENSYINAVKNSFGNALNYKSKLPHWILEMEGMSGKKYRHFINNLASSISNISNCRYLEIGSWKGSTFCSTIFDNKITSHAIDNWSQFGGPKDQFKFNVQRCIIESTENSDIKFTIDEKSYTDVDFSRMGKYNLYFYDGNHDYQDQYNAIDLFLNVLDEEFIFICDDWNQPTVEEATLNAIRDCKIDVLYSIDLKTNMLRDGIYRKRDYDWHMGYYIAVCKKRKE